MNNCNNQLFNQGNLVDFPGEAMDEIISGFQMAKLVQGNHSMIVIVNETSYNLDEFTSWQPEKIIYVPVILLLS